MVALEGIAIHVKDDQQGGTFSIEITIRENRILALIHAVRVELAQNLGEGNNFKIAFNQVEGRIGRSRQIHWHLLYLFVRCIKGSATPDWLYFGSEYTVQPHPVEGGKIYM